jgi:hypothetical protein
MRPRPRGELPCPRVRLRTEHCRIRRVDLPSGPARRTSGWWSAWRAIVARSSHLPCQRGTSILFPAWIPLRPVPARCSGRLADPGCEPASPPRGDAVARPSAARLPGGGGRACWCSSAPDRRAYAWPGSLLSRWASTGTAYRWFRVDTSLPDSACMATMSNSNARGEPEPTRRLGRVLERDGAAAVVLGLNAVAAEQRQRDGTALGTGFDVGFAAVAMLAHNLPTGQPTYSVIYQSRPPHDHDDRALKKLTRAASGLTSPPNGAAIHGPLWSRGVHLLTAFSPSTDRTCRCVRAGLGNSEAVDRRRRAAVGSP